VSEISARQPLREPEIVLNRRALTCLPPRRLTLHHHGAQPLRRPVHRGGQASRAGAHNAHVIQRLPGAGTQPQRASEIKGRRRAERLAVGDQHERQIGRGGVGEVVQPAALGVALDVIPPVRHVVTGQEHLDVVAAIGPPVPDHPHIGGMVRVGPPPVVKQVIDDRVQPLLGRIPRLEQVVVQADVVDRLDRDVRVSVRREQQVFRARRMGARLPEHFDARHLRHPLVSNDQRHRLVTQGHPGQHRQRLRPRSGAHNLVAGAVATIQVTGDRRSDHWIIVDRQDDRLAHGSASGNGLTARPKEGRGRKTR